VIGAGVALAGPGHDHGEAGATAAQGDAPRRLPDGELFLPKPTQRLLNIRTRVLKPEIALSTDRLIGRVIADPNRSGLVQSTIGGRIRATDDGLPILGQRVKKGQILAFVEPAFAPIDVSDVRQTKGIWNNASPSSMPASLASAASFLNRSQAAPTSKTLRLNERDLMPATKL